jgi:DNA polymerase (family 10)
MKNKELAHIFHRIADALEFKGENVFKIIAYRKAARVLDELTKDIEVLNSTGTLHELPGIGKAIAEKIHEYLTTGTMKKYEEVMKDIPSTILDMLNVQNIGPKTLALAYNALGVCDIEDLKKAIKDGSLARLPQMGNKKVANIAKGIELFEQSLKRLSLATAERIADEIIKYLQSYSKSAHVSPAGSLRRWKETIGDIDILATGIRGGKLTNAFTNYPKIERVIADGETKASIIVKGGIQVDLRIVKPQQYGAALQYFTGSKAHNVRLRNIAKSKGLKLSEYGIFKGKKNIASKTERDVYRTLGLAYVPPELREDRGEIEAAMRKKLPHLVDMKRIRGDLQMHSTYSDSSATIADLAKAASALGYKYILITDHSASAKYAHGLDKRRLHAQWKEIAKVNRKYKTLRILRGAEVDILSNGALDYPDTILQELDIVIAAIHQGFKKNVTERICGAMDNPLVDIIAHPTGRIISQREGYQVDVHAVIEHAVRTKTWLELNAFPDRLDLNDVYLKYAKELGAKIAIGTDAHSIEGLSWMEYGVATARRGWLENADVVNTFSLKKLLSFRKRR